LHKNPNTYFSRGTVVFSFGSEEIFQIADMIFTHFLDSLFRIGSVSDVGEGYCHYLSTLLKLEWVGGGKLSEA
jgi:hypothetical protein